MLRALLRAASTLGTVPASLIGALFVFGCSAVGEREVASEGGQTGSAGCSVSPKCICDSVGPLQLLRGVYHGSGANTADIEVLEAYGSGNPLSAGTTVLVTYQVGFPCGLGALPALREGSEVLVAYASSEAGEPASTSFVVQWDATLKLTPEFSLPADDVDALVDPAACAERFPDREPVCQQNL